MNPIFENKIEGRVLFANNELLIKYNLGKIFITSSEKSNWQVTNILPVNTVLDSFSYYFHLFARLLRNGVHHLVLLPTNEVAFIYNKRLQIVSSRKDAFDLPIPSSRPLSFEHIGNKLIFGEYRSNPERTPVSIFSININDNASLEKVYTFENIRHIHGVFQDPYSHSIYVTTGDDDHEAAIYKTDNFFHTMEKVLSGSQQTRAIKLLFDENYIYFGSDTPNEKNYLYKLHKHTSQLTTLTAVGSSVFHGCKVKNWLFFSTAIEPSNVNKTKYAEVWGSPDGSQWKCVVKLKKDIFPKRYFQYGQIFFPKGTGDDKNIWISPFATKYSNKSIKIPLSTISKNFNQI